MLKMAFVEKNLVMQYFSLNHYPATFCRCRFSDIRLISLRCDTLYACSIHPQYLDNSCRMCQLHLNQQHFSVRLGLNLSTNGGALADPEYVRMVEPQFEPRKKVANFCVRFRASESILKHVITYRWTLLWLSTSFCWYIGSRERWDPT